MNPEYCWFEIIRYGRMGHKVKVWLLGERGETERVTLIHLGEYHQDIHTAISIAMEHASKWKPGKEK